MSGLRHSRRNSELEARRKSKSRSPYWWGILSLPLTPFLLGPSAFGAEFETHGFLLFNASGRTTDERPAGSDSDFVVGEARLRLELSAWADSIEAAARFKGDLIHDAVGDETELDVREAYLDYASDNLDLRLGRQIATWGVGDLIFINDVFPKDWVSFFSGRPLEYLKTAVDGLRLRYSSTTASLELLAIPFFTPDTVPTTERFFLFDPFAMVSNRAEVQPPSTFDNTELALRYSRRVRSFDVAAYAYEGFWRAPTMQPDNFSAPTQVRSYYPDLSVYGASAQGNLLRGVMSFEVGYYDSRQDRDGDDPVVPNSQTRFLIGYQRQLQQDLTIGFQYYGELIANHGAYERVLPAGFPAQRHYRDTVTLRLEQLRRHQTLRLALFAFYSPADDDYLVQPLASYQFSDELSTTLGANIFGGRQATTFLGQFDKNDNLYLSVRFDF